MSSVSTVEAALIVAVFTSLISLIPLATVVIQNYLTNKANELKISNLPTHSDVQDAIQKKVNELATNGYTTVTTKSPTIPEE